MRKWWLVVALLLVACGGADPTASSPTPTPTASPTPTSTSQAERPTLDDLHLGDLPAIDYVEDYEYVAVDGARSSLPRGHGIGGAVPFAGGFLVSDTRWFEGTNGLALVRDGRRVRDWPSGRACHSGTPVAEGRWVAWVSLHCPESLDSYPNLVHRARRDGGAEVAQAVGRTPSSVVGLLGSEVVYNVGFIDGAWITDFENPPRRVPGIRSVADVDDVNGRLIGRRRSTRLVVDTRGELLWRANEGSLIAFSPRGSRVLGRVRDGYVVLDADNGSRLATFDLPGRLKSWDLAWEDERHVLAVVQARGRTAVLRLGPAGLVERATPVLALPDPLDPPYVLGAPS